MRISKTTYGSGELFGQKAKAIGIARGEMDAAMAYAQGQGWDVDRLFAETKASVGSFGTTDYALHTPSAFDFAEFLRPQTILGRLSGLRHVPSHTRLIAQTAGSTAWWVGERQVRPISKSQYTGLTLRPLGNTAITVVTSELVRSSDPKAEPILTRDLARSAVHALDSAFSDPANGGEANVKPASVFFGATARVSSGSALANIDADLDYIINALVLAGSDPQWAHFIMLPRTALYLARLRGTGGDLAYPGLSVKGGNLFGIPVVVSVTLVVRSNPTRPTKARGLTGY